MACLSKGAHDTRDVRSFTPPAGSAVMVYEGHSEFRL
jgi:hypothetical protein